MDSLKRVEEAVLETVSGAAQLPKAGEEYALFASSSGGFRAKCELLERRAADLLRRIAGSNGAEDLSDVIANLRESALLALDHSRGVSNVTEKIQAASVKALALSGSSAAVEKKPQEWFEDYPIDNSRSPFKPKLKSKPHAVVPLEESIRLETIENIPDELMSHLEALGKQKKSNFYRNPYEHEIRVACEESAPRWLWKDEVVFELRKRMPVSTKKLRKGEEREPDSLERVPFQYVEEKSGFDEMLAHLSQKEHLAIAVDLEHHSLRSFQGITCLMQISTSERDFIIDTLKLRSHMPRLLPVFANPAVVKVFHGADYDVEWLQRDFGLYVVQMFDTGQAARVLAYESASLAYALDRHCKVTANKALQLADWRIRPLTPDMLKYAREDTHFLLGIFDAMRRELVRLGVQSKHDAVQKVIERSADIALKAYDKPVFDPDGFKELYLSSKDEPSAQEQAVARALFEWRDSVARREDESVEYVLSARGLLRLAKACPRNQEQLLKELDGIKGAPILKFRLAEIADLVTTAVKSAANDVRTAPGAEEPKRKLTQGKEKSVSELGNGIKNDSLYCGINGRGGVYPFEWDENLIISNQIGNAKDKAHFASRDSGLVISKRQDSALLKRVVAIDTLIADAARAEVKARLDSVAAMKEAVENILNDVAKGSALQVEPKRSEPPKSLVERYNLSIPSSKRSRVENEEQEAPSGPAFQYTSELAAKAGAVPKQEKAESAKQSKKSRWDRRDNDDGEEKPAASAAKTSSAPVAKPAVAKNPYLLKPHRSLASSTSYVPK